MILDMDINIATDLTYAIVTADGTIVSLHSERPETGWGYDRELVELRSAHRVGHRIEWDRRGVEIAPALVTDEQIEALRDEAGAAGDDAQIAICDSALSGDRAARAECVCVLADAQAMRD